MASWRTPRLSLLACVLAILGPATAVFPTNQQCQEDGIGISTGPNVEHSDSIFSRLMGSVSPEALHELLHSYLPDMFQHGVFDSDQSALKAVLTNDPILATSIVQLARRQANETTVTETTATETTAPTTTTITDPDNTDSPTTTTATEVATSPTSNTEIDTSVVVSTETTAVESPSVTSTDATATSTRETQTATSIVTSTNAGETSDSSPSASSTETTLETSTTPATPTTAPPSTRRTSTFTSTLPGGRATTITTVEVVTPDGSDEATQTATESGALQSGLGVPGLRKGVIEAIAGAVVGGVLLV